MCNNYNTFTGQIQDHIVADLYTFVADLKRSLAPQEQRKSAGSSACPLSSDIRYKGQKDLCPYNVWIKLFSARRHSRWFLTNARSLSHLFLQKRGGLKPNPPLFCRPKHTRIEPTRNYHFPNLFQYDQNALAALQRQIQPTSHDFRRNGALYNVVSVIIVEAK